ncbi:MAG: DUF2891 domain-containing protein [Anaerolineales bacterium]|nr:DUF2891 domain-containing protein [Anaerolineales bacterium]
MSTTGPALDQAAAAGYAALALAGLQREFPYHPQHVLTGPADARRPRELHPAFYGCFDWHSAVHGHWLLVRLLRGFPDLPAAGAIHAALDERLTAANLAEEARYLRARPGFERPYGWAWLLKLAQEVDEWGTAAGRRWRDNLRPLTDTISAHYQAFFPKQVYPIRAGTHANTAFGLAFAWDYAAAAGQVELRDLVRERGLAYFANDRDGPAGWEPGGNDFFSACLLEADLMRRLLPAAEFAAWLTGFLPGLAAGQPASLFTPARVTDRADGQLTHLDGLNLSRAWCFWGLARALDPEDPRQPALRTAAERHAAAGLPHVASGHYAGEHWLATFAVYALESAAGRA